MANAKIQFTQGASTPGPGYAMLGATGTSVTVSNGDDADVAKWTFTVIDVGVGSTVSQGVVQDGAIPAWSFVPDVSGCYVVQLETTDRQGNVYQDQRVFGVLETNGLLIPSFMASSGSMNFVTGSVENEKGWSPFLNAWLKAFASGGTPASYTLDCTGATILAPAVYAGPIPVPPTVILTGTVAGAFAVTLPPAAFTVVRNRTAYTAEVGSAFVTANSSMTVKPYEASDAGGVGAGVGFDDAAWDVILAAVTPASGSIPQVISIAASNTAQSGYQLTIPVYGARLNQLDAGTYGVALPGIGVGPQGFSGVQTWYTAPTPGAAGLQSGAMSQDQGGSTTTMAPAVVFPTTAWNTQALVKGACIAGATLVGPGVSGTFQFSLPTGVTSATVKLMARVVSSSVDTVGSPCVFVGEFCWRNNGAGVISVVTTRSTEPSTFWDDAALGAVAFAAATDGVAYGEITYATGSLIDASTTIDFQLYVLEAVTL